MYKHTVGLQVSLFKCPVSESQCRPGNFPLLQKLLDFEGFGTLPLELLQFRTDAVERHLT